MHLNEEDKVYHQKIIQRVREAQMELNDSVSAGDHWFQYLIHRYGINVNDEVNEQGEIIPFVDPNLPVEDNTIKEELEPEA